MSLEARAKRCRRKGLLSDWILKLGADQREAVCAPPNALVFLHKKVLGLTFEASTVSSGPTNGRLDADVASCAAPDLEAGEEPALGFLHPFGRLRIALGLRLLIQVRNRQLSLEMTG